MSQAALPECSVVTGYAQPRERPDLNARPRGRPKTRTGDHYRQLLREHEMMAHWFSETYGGAARSDIELFKAYFIASFEERGMRASRIASPEFKSKLKTLRNELSVARRLVADCPEKQPLTGTTCAPN